MCWSGYRGSTKSGGRPVLIQSLERRRLFAVTISQTYPGYWEIHGDAEANSIVVSVSQEEGTIAFDGQVYSASYVSVYGYGGNDTIEVSGGGLGDIGGSVSAGEGDDTVNLGIDGAIWGGTGCDMLYLANSFRGEAYGEDGDDHIYISGETIDAEIVGGEGDDLINAQGNNYGLALQGGAGNDTIFGSHYNDQIFGGGGTDFLYGGGGNDNFYEGAFVSGGGGFDTYRGSPPLYGIFGVESIE